MKTLSAVTVASIAFTGCMGGNQPAPAAAPAAAPQFFCEQDGVRAPEWTCNPYVEGAMAAIGIAKMNAGGDKSFQRTEAMADARDALASQIETKVSNLFKSYKASTGTGDSATFDQSSSKVSKQLASQTIQGSKQRASWTNPKTKELYLLVAVSSEPVKQSMENAVKTSFKDDQALYQKFLSEKANGELDKELEKAGK